MNRRRKKSKIYSGRKTKYCLYSGYKVGENVCKMLWGLKDFQLSFREVKEEEESLS